MRPRPLLLLLALGVLALTLPASASAAPVWLCKPGLKRNPCEPKLDTTRYTPSGKRLGVDRIRRPARTRADCFYVYPTVSDDQGPQADRSIDPELRSIALYQAARYSRYCRVYAPVYRQITISGLVGAATPEQREQAYADVLEAWRVFLRRHNRGRPFVLIGHSQGTGVLRRLVQEEIDRRPAVRRRLVSALLLGGRITVAEGRDRGGDFRNVPACRSRRQIGCVIAFNTFNEPVPAASLFGRTTEPGREVLCTNPAALRGGPGLVTPIYPTEPFAGNAIRAVIGLTGGPTPRRNTAWASYPGSYRARCSSAGGANVLQIVGRRGAPRLKAAPSPGWGLHITDANIALGELEAIVRAQIDVARGIGG